MQPTNRLVFILDFIFNGYTNLAWRTTNNQQAFEDFIGPKINYSTVHFSTSKLNIVPTGLIEQTALISIVSTVEWINDLPIIYPVNASSNISIWPFDLFSAIFFLLTRYEEYNNPVKDQFGRFPATESLAFKHGFLHLPIVDIWLQQLVENIAANYTHLHFPAKKIQVNFTYDIDTAYAYKGRNTARQIGAIGKDIIGFKMARLANRMAVLCGLAKDPSDSYEYIFQTSINPIFFFLLAQKLSRYDRNINPASKVFLKLVNKVKDHFPIGIHPSFYSSVQPQKLADEIKMLTKIGGSAIDKSRQHYLKFTMPSTYRELIKNGIKEDYSMGFAEMPGFRAGTATPFYFFDIEKNEKTILKIFPCCIMETMFRHEAIMPLKEALPYFIKYFEAVRKVNGHFICIWHNDSLPINNNINNAQNFVWLHNAILQYIRNTTP